MARAGAAKCRRTDGETRRVPKWLSAKLILREPRAFKQKIYYQTNSLLSPRIPWKKGRLCRFATVCNVLRIITQVRRTIVPLQGFAKS